MFILHTLANLKQTLDLIEIIFFFKKGGKPPIYTEVPSSPRYSAAKINMFSFSLEMQMVSKCLIVYLVPQAQPT